MAETGARHPRNRVDGSSARGDISCAVRESGLEEQWLMCLKLFRCKSQVVRLREEKPHNVGEFVVCLLITAPCQCMQVAIQAGQRPCCRSLGAAIEFPGPILQAAGLP